jgi:hypothetical protein
MDSLNYNISYPSARSPVFGRDAVATSHPLASRAGMAMLMRGGIASRYASRPCLYATAAILVRERSISMPLSTRCLMSAILTT